MSALLGSCAIPGPEAGREHVRSEAEARLRTEVALGARAEEVAAEVLRDGILAADEAVRLALANNRRLQAILEDLDIARAELWQASLAPNPVLDAELQLVEGGGGDLLELAVAQSVVDLLLIPRRRQVSAERYEAVELEVTAAVLDLATEVRSTYRRLQAQRELVELYVAATTATRLSYDAARRLREAGNVLELDVLRERALYEETKVALVAARTMVRRHRESLNALLGLWGPEGERWEVLPRLPASSALELPAHELEERVLAASVDLRARSHRLVALGHAVGLERAEAIWSEGSLGVKAEREPDETWSVGPLASVSLPVLDLGNAASAEARARFRQAYEEYTDLAVRLRRSARSAYVVSESSGANSRYLREVVVPLRSQITEQTQRQFNAMQLGLFQLLEARRREIEAGRSYVETLREHWLARVRLEALLLGRMPRERFGIGGPAGEPGPSGESPSDGGGHG